MPAGQCPAGDDGLVLLCRLMVRSRCDLLTNWVRIFLWNTMTLSVSCRCLADVLTGPLRSPLKGKTVQVGFTNPAVPLNTAGKVVALNSGVDDTSILNVAPQECANSGGRVGNVV